MIDYNQRVIALNENIKLGQQLKTTASNILGSLNVHQADVKDLATLIKAATDAATKGAKLEVDSRKELELLTVNLS